MPTFSLLLKSLDQTIDRKSLEDASVSARSIARADCARLHREMSGILVSQLEMDEAVAFQQALRARNFPTDVVADADIPALPPGLQIQRIEHRDEVLVLTDSMMRERVRPLSDLVFLAAGFVNRLDFKTETRQFLDFGGPRGGAPSMVTERELVEENETQFRVDFFFWSEPHRLHAVLSDETTIFHEGNPVRMRMQRPSADS